MGIVKVTEENFEQEVLKADKPVLVDFFATWCGPCKMFSPVMDELAEELGDSVKVCKIDIDESMDIASRYKIMSVPTLIAFKDGEIINKAMGVQSPDVIKKMVQ